MRTDHAELVRIAARTVLSEEAAGRSVDPQRLAWAHDILSQNPDDAPSRACFDEVQQIGEFFDRLESA